MFGDACLVLSGSFYVNTLNGIKLSCKYTLCIIVNIVRTFYLNYYYFTYFQIKREATVKKLSITKTFIKYS